MAQPDIAAVVDLEKELLELGAPKMVDRRPVAGKSIEHLPFPANWIGEEPMRKQESVSQVVSTETALGRQTKGEPISSACVVSDYKIATGSTQ